jgi:hypothetical protein
MDQIWRHNQAGDLPGIGDEIDRQMLRELVLANRGKRGFTFSHKPLTAKNAAAIRAANGAGFTINVSADNLSEADEFIVRSVGPVVVLLPEEARFHPKRHASTPAGNRIVVCPAERADLESRRITCKTCQLCAVVDRKTIVGFPAHGGRKNRVSALASASSPDLGDKRSLSHRIF